MAIKVLFLTGGEIHDWKGVGDEVEQTLRGLDDVEVTRVDNDTSIFEAPRLEPYDVVVVFYTIGELSDAQKNGLLNFIAGGKGFVGIHSAADSFKNSPEYIAMIGGQFVTHPAYREYQVSVVDPEHPITKDLVEFNVIDEMYVTNYDPRVQILASALWKGGITPVAWTKSWGKGRVFYLALGHDAPACRQEVFRLMLTRGVLWAAGK